MAGVRKAKAKKMMAKAASQSPRTVKGRNKVKRIPRQDRKKPANSGKK